MRAIELAALEIRWKMYVAMMQTTPSREIANELPVFKPLKDREKLLGVIGALVLRKNKPGQGLRGYRNGEGNLLGAVRCPGVGIFISGGAGRGSGEDLVMVVV